jgi:hypothetical protein
MELANQIIPSFKRLLPLLGSLLVGARLKPGGRKGGAGVMGSVTGRLGSALAYSGLRGVEKNPSAVANCSDALFEQACSAFDSNPLLRGSRAKEANQK